MSKLKAAFKKTVFSLVAILLGLVVALTMAEGILRITNTTPYHRNALNAFHEPDPYLGWRGRPGFTGTFVREDFKAVIAMDDKGYRKKDAKTQPFPDAADVVFLGDSFAWGWGVSQGELFSDVLQDLLGPRYNVINLGMNTFGTVQEWIQLEREVLPMKPSRVGILFYANDFEDNLNGRGDSRPYCEVENGRVVLRNIPIAHPVGGNMRSIMRNSYALTHARYYYNIFREYVEIIKKRIKRWILKQQRSERPDSRPTTGGKDDDSEEPSTEAAIMVFEHALSEISRLCRDNTIELFVVYVPTADNIASGRPEYDNIHLVRRACNRYGIFLIDLMPEYIPRITGSDGEPLYFTRDLHWTAEGHRLAAEIIRQRIWGRP